MTTSFRQWARQMGQQVVVENIGGAGGALGLQRVLAAAPDGHTRALGTPSELVLTPMALPAVKYRPEDWRLAALIARTPLFLLVRGDLPVNSVDGLIAVMRTNASCAHRRVRRGARRRPTAAG